MFQEFCHAPVDIFAFENCIIYLLVTLVECPTRCPKIWIFIPIYLLYYMATFQISYFSVDLSRQFSSTYLANLLHLNKMEISKKSQPTVENAGEVGDLKFLSIQSQN